jgi:hypothetical protein
MQNYSNSLLQNAKLDLTELYTTQLLNLLNPKQIRQLHDYHFDSVCDLKSQEMIQDENEFERFLNDLVCEYGVTRFYKPSLSA